MTSELLSQTLGPRTGFAAGDMSSANTVKYCAVLKVASFVFKTFVTCVFDGRPINLHPICNWSLRLQANNLPVCDTRLPFPALI